MNVLVAYASRHGATEGIAQRVAQRLGEHGLHASLMRAEEVRDPGGYDAFVVGAAAYAFHWMKPAAQFVRRNSALLATRPTWLFSSGPVGREKVDKEGRDVLETAVPKEFAEFAETVNPRGLKVFFGAYDPDLPPVDLAERFMKGFMQFMPAVRDALPTGNFRDWPAIDAWADGIGEELNARVAVPS